MCTMSGHGCVSKKYKGEVQEAKQNILIGDNGKEQELHYGIQELLVPDNERPIVCLRKWCGKKQERHLRNRRDTQKWMGGMMSSEMGTARLVALGMKTNTGRVFKII